MTDDYIKDIYRTKNSLNYNIKNDLYLKKEPYNYGNTKSILNHKKFKLDLYRIKKNKFSNKIHENI